MSLISSLSLGRMLKKLWSNISGGFWLNTMTHFLNHFFGTNPFKKTYWDAKQQKNTVSEFPATKANTSKKTPIKIPSNLGVSFRVQQQTSWASPIKERANMLVKPRSWISAAPLGGWTVWNPKDPEAAEDECSGEIIWTQIFTGITMLVGGFNPVEKY